MSQFSQYPLLTSTRVPLSSRGKQYHSDKNEYVRYLHGAYDSDRSFMNERHLRNSLHCSCQICDQQQILEDTTQYEVEDNLKHQHQENNFVENYPIFNNQFQNARAVSFSNPISSQVSPYFHPPPSLPIYQQINRPINQLIPHLLPPSNPQATVYSIVRPIDVTRPSPWQIVKPPIVHVAPPIRFISHQPPVRYLQQIQRIQPPVFIQRRFPDMIKSVTAQPFRTKIQPTDQQQISPLTLKLDTQKSNKYRKKCLWCRYCQEEKSVYCSRRRHV